MRNFQEVVRYCSLSDMSTHGPKFTWCNKQEEGVICKKLDRVLHNMSWTQSFSQSYCVMESGGCSDHLRGKIFVSSDIQKPKGPFKFTNAIASQPEFLLAVEDHWRQSSPLFHSTSSLFWFSKKLKLLKPSLRALSRKKMANISTRASEAYEDLCSRQMAVLASPSPQVVAEESIAFERWERVVGLEESFLKQKSKLHWLQVGDKNNKFFHNAVKERHSVNSIHSVIDHHGVTLTDMEEIKGEAARFFFGTAHH
ncbi:hypothetical protein V5N11_004951 [Cardamine amara subsp. amara]|uniref:Uncharacterized protein n=1 Tax=Cardamine amara subsp. amara TaxID=228776 RepID=A0ABD0ZX33_CARAN